MMFCCAHIITNSNANTNSTTYLCQQPRKPLTHSEIKILKKFRLSKRAKKKCKVTLQHCKGTLHFWAISDRMPPSSYRVSDD